MEVHHHSHTARKKRAHYFWEFFMLFLAVTLGFFVENQREHMVEHKREKQYIKSMVVDLNTDTLKLSSLMRDHGRVVQGLDSFLVGYDEFASGVFSKSFFKYQWALDGFTDFIYTDRTIEQLKSSGGMRLIRNQAASDSIIAYDDDAQDYLIEQAGLQRVHNDMYTAINRLFNFRLAIKEFKRDSANLVHNKNLYLLLTKDPQEIESFYNLVDLYRNTVAAKRYLAGILKQKAVRLIGFLEKQYHLH